MRKSLTALTATAFLSIFAVSTWADDDKKGISGYGCFPQSGKFQADFFFGGGAIINNSSFTRNVVCTIFRDKYSTGSGSEVDTVRVYFTRDAAGGTTGLACQVLVRDLTTGTVTDSDVDSDNTTVGSGFLTLENLNYSSEFDAIYLFCILPAKSRIVGLRWEEDLNDKVGEHWTQGTESGEGE